MVYGQSGSDLGSYRTSRVSTVEDNNCVNSQTNRRRLTILLVLCMSSRRCARCAVVGKRGSMSKSAKRVCDATSALWH